MIKLVAYDVDGTLALHDGELFEGALEHLRRVHASGTKIALISAKPASYLAGFARQFGLHDVILGGEHGSDVLYGTHFPPKLATQVSFTSDEVSSMVALKRVVFDIYRDDIWLQPNQKTFCFFVKDPSLGEEIFELVRDTMKHHPLLTHFEYHEPACEILPNRVHKGLGLDSICQLFRFTPDEIIAVGDAKNDLPMFKVAGHSVGIGIHGAKYFVETPSIGYKTVEQIIHSVKKQDKK